MLNLIFSQMNVKGRTLILNEGKLATSDVAYKKAEAEAATESHDKTEEVSIVEETSKEQASTTEVLTVEEQ